MKINICHIGFPKTGTTYLQQYIFNQIDGLQFIYNNTVLDLFNQIINDDDTILKTKFIQAQFYKLFENSDINLCSYEPLTGQHQLSGFVNRSIIARRLKSFGFHKIIISIRNQYDIIESTYKQYIKTGGLLKFNEYFDFEQNQKRPNFRLAYYDYDSICQLYSSIFGKENILIIQYEQINTKPYFESIFNFTGLPFQKLKTQFYANKSISKNKTKLQRLTNRFSLSSLPSNMVFGKPLNKRTIHFILKKLPELTKEKSFLKDRHLEIINNFYKKSNAMLEYEFKLILNRLVTFSKY